ncbi:MAG: hypothetical protein II401_10965 [Bacteroidales bacterium]|nr:hypothetical protein [Bacteroidales bacterium]
MSNEIQVKHKQQQKTARLEIVAELYKRGWSMRKIRTEVMRRLDLKTYSLQTVHGDVKTLIEEWRESRLANMDDALTLELTRIDDTCRELWDQWEKSKTDYTKTTRRQKGTPRRNEETGRESIHTYQTERSETDVVGLGNPAYISEIRQQLAERRKLLGLYAPDKKELGGSLSFASMLVESGMLDEAEQQIKENEQE